MGEQTTPEQRRQFYVRHLRGETYRHIAEQMGVSWECVRHWCRRQRDGGSCASRSRRVTSTPLKHCDPQVRYAILRLRLEHPRWGPRRIHTHLGKRLSLRDLARPSPASIGRYLHQWPRFRRPPRTRPTAEKPRRATAVHQRWQIDFKKGIPLQDGSLVNLHTVRDPVGEACLGAFVFAAGTVGHAPQNVTLAEVQQVLRSCFAQWGALPDEVQTDSETVLTGHADDAFPSTFTLWLKALGVEHILSRPGRPTDNAEVERCHRTVMDYAVTGNEDSVPAQLNRILAQAVQELATELGSRAEGCRGKPPLTAHPELLQPRHPFRAEHELALCDLRRVDAYLATLTWSRRVGKDGRITLGGQHQYYKVGKEQAERSVRVTFDPADRHFIFADPADPHKEIGRQPARDLELSDLTGLAEWPTGLGPQQLPLPFPNDQGVSC
jgi:transposase InsO family protein